MEIFAYNFLKPFFHTIYIQCQQHLVYLYTNATDVVGIIQYFKNILEMYEKLFWAFIIIAKKNKLSNYDTKTNEIFILICTYKKYI